MIAKVCDYCEEWLRHVIYLGEKPAKSVNSTSVHYLKVENLCQIFKTCFRYLKWEKVCLFFWKQEKIHSLKVGNASLLLEGGNIGNWVKLLASHKKMSRRLFRIEAPCISDSKLRRHEFQTLTVNVISLSSIQRQYPKNIPRRPLLHYQTLDREDLLLPCRGRDSSRSFKGAFGRSLAWERFRGLNALDPECQEMLDSKKEKRR